MPNNRRKKISKNVFDALKRQTVEGDIKEPNLGRLVSNFFATAGGEVAVARMLFDEFTAAKQGSLTRQRILDLILRSLRFANEQNPPIDDLGILEDGDLERELETLVEAVQENVDGSHGPATAGE